jgi:hypothetical protein
MRIDVDFNERDREGHVVARVPGDQASQLAPGRRVYLYDPPERLWAEARVARINADTRIAAFDVDWHSFVDAEVVDLSDGHERWSVGVSPAEGHWLPRSVLAENFSGLLQVNCRYRIEVTPTQEPMHAAMYQHWMLEVGRILRRWHTDDRPDHWSEGTWTTRNPSTADRP